MDTNSTTSSCLSKTTASWAGAPIDSRPVTIALQICLCGDEDYVGMNKFVRLCVWNFAFCLASTFSLSLESSSA